LSGPLRNFFAIEGKITGRDMAARILIVEDEDTLRESLGRVLSREGYEVDGAASCEEAFHSIECGSYDLIIADIILPGVNGLELLKKCKADHPNLLVIIITAFASIETAVEAMRAGAYDYIIKPIVHDDLKAIIEKALREHPPGAA
jgi:DNA-binding NtrC family response regulator